VICFEINPTAKSILAVELPFIPDKYSEDPALVPSMDNGDVIYMDESGENKDSFKLRGFRYPIFGIAYIMGTNENGDDCPPKTAYDDLIESVTFIA
jgi:hypothetical protein